MKNLNSVDLAVIIVCYNSEISIEQCIKSIINQSVRPKQLIIIDGESDDQTINIINKYRNHITDFVSEKDSGIYDAMNKGMHLCKSEYFLYLNSDDYFANNSILQIYKNEILNKKIDFIFGNINLMSETRTIRKWNAEYSPRLIQFASRVPHPGFALKTEIVNLIGNFDIRYKIAADYDFILRVMKVTQNYYHIDTTVINMAIGGASTKGLKNLILQNLELCRSLIRNGYSIADILCFIYDRIKFKLGQKS